MVFVPCTDQECCEAELRERRTCYHGKKEWMVGSFGKRRPLLRVSIGYIELVHSRLFSVSKTFPKRKVEDG